MLWNGYEVDMFGGCVLTLGWTQDEGPKIPQPSVRINSSLVVRGNEMSVIWGKVEIDKREVTLDDMWSIDLSKMTTYK